MARRANGEGAIYLRGDGRWEAQLRLGAGRRRSVYGRTRREVLGKLREARWALNWGLPVSSRKLTLGDFLDRWLEVVKDRVRPSTYESYELNARRLRELADVPLTRLSPALIQSTYQHLVRRGLTAYSVLQAHHLLHRALNQAFRLGLVTKNAALLAYPPRPRRPEMTALSAGQLLVLLESSRGDRLHPLWVLLSCSGLRLGEALGLRWQDVDLEGGSLAVRRALQRRRSGGLVFVDPKTTRSRRAVVLADGAIAALRELRSHQAGLQLLTPASHDSGLIFTNLRGGPLEPGRANAALT